MTPLVEYDWHAMRWRGMRPMGMRWSEMVLGRCDTQRRCIAQKGRVTVSAYRVRDGRLLYPSANPQTPPGPRVIYRIHVKLKENRP